MPYISTAEYHRLKKLEGVSSPAQKYASPDEFRAFLATFLDHGIGSDTLSPDRLTFPVSRRTTVEIKFNGPAGVDEWDALLAHIAFYKTWFKDDEIAPAPMRRDEIIDAVVEAIERSRSPIEQT